MCIKSPDKQKQPHLCFRCREFVFSPSKMPPLGSSWASTWPSQSSQHRLSATGKQMTGKIGGVISFLGLTFYSKMFERIAQGKLMTGKSLIFIFALKNQNMYNPEKARRP